MILTLNRSLTNYKKTNNKFEFQEKVFFWKMFKSSSLIKGKLSFWLEGKNIKASFEKY